MKRQRNTKHKRKSLEVKGQGNRSHNRTSKRGNSNGEKEIFEEMEISFPACRRRRKWERRKGLQIERARESHKNPTLDINKKM